MLKEPNLNYSVVIPTHDRLDFLKNALQSIFVQSIEPYEIFIVDDLNQIKVKELIQNLSKKYSFNIKYIISKSKNGVSHSYNLGAKHAKSEYLAFLDDDDFWGKDYIHSISKIIKKNNFDIIISRLTEYDDQYKKSKPGKCLPQKFNIKDFYLRNPGVLRSNFFIKRSCFELARGYDEKIFGSSDKEIFMRLKILKKKHFVNDKPNLVYWRTNHKSQASINFRRMLRNVVNFYSKYFFTIPFTFHVKMIIKIIRLVYLSVRN